MTTQDAKNTPRSRRILLVGLLVFSLAVLMAGIAFANGTVSIDWWVLSGGGGGASGGNVTLDSTLGQPIAGPSSAGNAWLGAGYWYGEQPVQIFLPMLRR
jgi:hypothetical protein